MTAPVPTVLVLSVFLLAGSSSSIVASEGSPVAAPLEAKQHAPTLIQSDRTLRLNFGEERVILPHGLQPSLLCTRSGTLVVQAQVPGKPFASKRISYFSPM